MINFDQERPFDGVQIEALLDAAFGPDRFNKSSYSLRETVAPLASLSHVARAEGRIVGTVRFWPVLIKDLLRGSCEKALLLGPLAVAPSMQKYGIGSQLMNRSLAAASLAGHRRILLVGDIDYYCRFGFKNVLPNYITMPGGKDARRLLVRQNTSLPSLPAVGKIISADSVSVMPVGSIAAEYERGLPVAAA
ncbi:GNAT family N-acetyltransferase [Kordiimonas sp.]|uniref:GNAT family N-acetyltransferase n=1 Tax=Kordiimonas sp. TaxID=1970157 RepID=UPI003A917CBC